MATLTILNLPDEVHRALSIRAAMHERSMESEIMDILENAVKPEGRIKLGSLLAEIGAKLGGVDLGIERDKTPAEPIIFE
ncbi:MAG: Arc family DNA-binding protein [Methylomonas sp.]